PPCRWAPRKGSQSKFPQRWSRTRKIQCRQRHRYQLDICSTGAILLVDRCTMASTRFTSTRGHGLLFITKGTAERERLQGGAPGASPTRRSKPRSKLRPQPAAPSKTPLEPRRRFLPLLPAKARLAHPTRGRREARGLAPREKGLAPARCRTAGPCARPW